MTVDLSPLPSTLPQVEERPVMPGGFRAGTATVGIKDSGRPDLGVLATVNGFAGAAAVFTTNRIPAAPVRLSRANLEANGGRVAGVVSTSGSANAATGRQGEADQAQITQVLADALGVPADATLALSTGLIGKRLPVDKIRDPLRQLTAGGLAPTDDALAALGQQICTTDTRSKSATVRVGEVTVSGIAKGVGMIHPRMATMLALVLTDAEVAPVRLQQMLNPIVERTWNQLTVDGDTSTNDTVFLLASGAAGAIAESELAPAIEAVARSLARQQAADGEGATTLITCQVTGARTDQEARAAARAVVSSSLVKAAVHGRDPNWGRIAAAVGNATIGAQPVAVEEARLAVAIAGVAVFSGKPVAFDKAAVSKLMDARELNIRVDLGLGEGVGEAFGCDLTEQYVVENSAYST